MMVKLMSKLHLNTKHLNMKNPLKRTKKAEPMKENKFAGKRQYRIRTGLAEKTLVRLKDLYELLQCDPDEHGYVVTTFKEMNELTEMDLVLLSIMLTNGMLLKRNTGGSPKFKYKWDTIKPNKDMVIKLINTKYENGKKGSTIVSESQPESIVVEEKEDVEVKAEEIKSEPKPDVVLDSLVNGDIMTMHVNLSKLGLTESAVLNAVLSLKSSI